MVDSNTICDSNELDLCQDAEIDENLSDNCIEETLPKILLIRIREEREYVSMHISSLLLHTIQLTNKVN